MLKHIIGQHTISAINYFTSIYRYVKFTPLTKYHYTFLLYSQNIPYELEVPAKEHCPQLPRTFHCLVINWDTSTDNRVLLSCAFNHFFIHSTNV